MRYPRTTAIKVLTSTAFATLLAAWYAPAQAKRGVWVGYVVHASTENIKVREAHGQVTLGFVVVPKLTRIVSADGKTRYRLSQLKPGTLVKVEYDQRALGARHADRIVVLSH